MFESKIAKGALAGVGRPGRDSANAQFRRFADEIPSFIWTAGPDGQASFFNRRWYEATGQTPEEAEGSGWLEAVHVDDCQRVRGAWERAVQSCTEYEVEARYRMRNDSYRWHLVRATAILDDHNAVDHWLGIGIDIDDRHASETMAVAQTQAIVETAVDGIITIDELATIQSFNPSAERLFGYTATEVIGQNIKLLMPEPYRSEHDQYVANYLRTGQQKVIGKGREVRGQRKDGSTFPMDLAVSEMELTDRRYFTGIVRDVSERNQLALEAQGQSRVLERLAKGDSLSDVLKSLIEFAEEARPAMAGSIFLLDQETLCLRYGAVASLPDFYCEALDGARIGPNVGSCGTAAHTGQRVIVEDIQGHPFWKDYAKVAARASLRACWSEPIVSSTGDVIGAFAMCFCERRSPTASDLEFIASCANVAALAIERAEVDMSLRRLASVVEHSGEAIIGERPDRTIESWNRGAERIYGYRAAEVIGKPISILVPEAQVAELQELFERLVQGGRIEQFETLRLTRDGRLIDVSLTISPVQDADGSTIGFSTIAHDVSELKKTRKKLVEAERLSTIGQMLAAIAHESRNALQRIGIGIDMLELVIDDHSGAGEDLERIRRAQQDLQRLFDELRGYAAPIQLELDTLSLASIWRQAWSNLESLRQGREARLEEQIDGLDMNCRVDAFRMEQVFRNIFENALAASSDSLLIDIRCTETALGPAPAICVSIRDNGPGLSDEQKLHMFEAFYTTKPKGTGLGMAIARRIIEAHQGAIQAGQGDYPGTEIMIALPRQSPATDA